MKKELINPIVFCLIALLAFSLFGCSAKIQSQNSDMKSNTEKDLTCIKFAVDAKNEPFEYLDENENFLGFDMYLAYLISSDMEKTPQFFDIEKKNLIPSVVCGIADASISSLENVKENDDIYGQINYSKPYLTLSCSIVIDKRNKLINSIKDLKSAKSISCVYGSYEENYLKNTLGLSNIVSSGTYKDAYLKLSEKKCDALFVEGDFAKSLISTYSDLKITEENIAQKEFCVAVRKDDEKLLKSINECIDKNIKDTTIMQLKEAYLFGNSEYKEKFNRTLIDAQ